MCPVTLPASWVASTKRCKDAGSVHSSSMDATEDAAARRVIAGQGAGERCRVRHQVRPLDSGGSRLVWHDRKAPCPPTRRSLMEAGSVARTRDFDHLREHSIGLPAVLFQSITHMAPAAAVAYSIYISVPHAGASLPLAVFIALAACLLAASSIGQLAKELPSAGGLYTYAARTLGPYVGWIVAWFFMLFEPLVAPFLFLECGWA